MTDVKMLVEVTVHLPGDLSYLEAEKRASSVITGALAMKLAVKDVSIVKALSVVSYS